MTVEKILERKLREAIKARKGIALKLISSSFTGLPDRMCLLPGGNVFFVELKSTGKKVTAIQGKVHELLRSLCFPVYVIDSETGLKSFLKLIDSAC